MDAEGRDGSGKVQDGGRGGWKGSRWMELGDGGNIGEGEFLESAKVRVAQVGSSADNGDVVARFEVCDGRWHRFHGAGKGGTKDCWIRNGVSAESERLVTWFEASWSYWERRGEGVQTAIVRE